MDDNLDHARKAVARGENGEALVFLWNAFDSARASEDPDAYDDVAKLAEKVAERGDESEQADAEVLLAEIDRAHGESAGIEVGTFGPVETPQGMEAPTERADYGEPAEDDADYEPAARKKGSPLWGLIGLGVFLFFLLRDVLQR